MSEWLVTWEETYSDGHCSSEQHIVGSAPTCGDALRIFVEERSLSSIVEIENLHIQSTKEV